MRPMPLVVRGDPVRIKQVVSNLVSNALKFTPEGGTVTIGARLANRTAKVDDDGAVIGPVGRTRERVPTAGTTLSSSSARLSMVNPFGGVFSRAASGDEEDEEDLPTAADGKYRIAITVRDTGVGIGAEDLEGLFVPYKQARHGVEYTGSSSGLGLYISRGIARQMGGDLRGMSGGMGMGSEFVFEFEARAQAGVRSPGGTLRQQNLQVSRVWRRMSLNRMSSGSRSGTKSSTSSHGHSSTRGRDERTESEAGPGFASLSMLQAQSDASATADGTSTRAGAAAGQTGIMLAEATVALNISSDAAMSSKKVTESAPAISGKTPSSESSKPFSGSTSGRRSVGKRKKSEAGKRAKGAGGDMDSEGVATVVSSEQIASVGGVRIGLKAWCLVVDDVAPNRVLLARGLKRLGYATHLAAHGKEALEACRQRVAEAVGAGVVLLPSD